MTNYTNDDLYQIALDRLRKDRKGSISAEEFENFLNNRSIDYFNQQLSVEGESKMNHEGLLPFLEKSDISAITSDLGVYYIPLTSLPTGTTTTTPDTGEYLLYEPAQLINVWYSSSYASLASITEIDMVTSVELPDRINNAITGPTIFNPIGYHDSDRIWVWGLTGGYGVLDYYRNPLSAYYDYYTDADGNITYLTDGQAAYTLLTGEVARDGSVAGAAVTSASVDLEWRDKDAMNILDMVMTDIGIAMSDEGVTQGSVLERQQNA